MIVVDTNILAYRWLPGTRTAEALALTRFDPLWAAPVLWRSELRNVLAGYLRRGALDEATAESAMAHAAECLLGGEHVVADKMVFELVRRSKCSAYDCEFVGLAMALQATLVTEDRAVREAFPAFCRSLEELIGTGN